MEIDLDNLRICKHCGVIIDIKAVAKIKEGEHCLPQWVCPACRQLHTVWDD